MSSFSAMTLLCLWKSELVSESLLLQLLSNNLFFPHHCTLAFSRIHCDSIFEAWGWQWLWICLSLDLSGRTLFSWGQMRFVTSLQSLYVAFPSLKQSLCSLHQTKLSQMLILQVPDYSELPVGSEGCMWRSDLKAAVTQEQSFCKFPLCLADCVIVKRLLQSG